jgi:TetR/AcrR family transcriptional regulator, regulator of cefoperazone and chloramphenicol sensitivity
MNAKSQRGNTARSPSKSRTTTRAVHQKGQETQERILNAAMKAFGEASFLAVTTRDIAQAASVSLPTLQYYFGHKEGLYRACAEAIVERYRSHMMAAGAKARGTLDEGASGETARVQLKALFAALGGFLVGSKEASRWAPFLARELRDPGPAFEILYSGLWRPGVQITARLIARILGIPETDPAARIQALLLISSLLAFQSGRTISLRTLRWTTVGPAELAMVLAGVEAQIDAIGHIRS